MTVPGRRSSTFIRLLRSGFTDPSAAARLLDADALAAVRTDPVLLDALGATADPDLALLGLVRLAEAQPDGELPGLLDTLVSAKPLRDRLLGVLGASEALGDHLARHPRDWLGLVTYEAADLHPGLPEFELGLADAHDPVGLRVAYRRCLLSIAARDVCGTIDVAQTAAELADLATATLRAALRIASAAAPEDAALCRLAVIAMGKCGGNELNYVSDVDVIFVGDAAPGADEGKALQAATRLASHLMRICSETTVEGTIWPVDANLRPEGRNGPLVRTLASHLAYYQRWAKTWEFQALLKARAVMRRRGPGRRVHRRHKPAGLAGRRTRELRGRRPEDAPPRRRQHPCRPGRPRAETGPRRPARRRVRRPAAPARARPQRRHPALRHHPRRPARPRGRMGYVGRADAAQLHDAYRFLRAMEHRIQLYRLRRTHLVPEDENDLRRLGRSMGLRTEPVAELNKAWRRHASVVRRLHEKLFYRPLLDAVAQLTPGETRLSPRAARPAPRSPRLRRPGLGPAPPRSPRLRRHPQGRHPAHPAAGHARLVRRLRRPGQPAC